MTEEDQANYLLLHNYPIYINDNVRPTHLQLYHTAFDNGLQWTLWPVNWNNNEDVVNWHGTLYVPWVDWEVFAYMMEKVDGL